MEKTLPIPQPKRYGPLGNLPLIDKDSPSLSFDKIFDEQGPIFRFEFFGRASIMTCDPALVADVCDESRFDKNLGHLLNVRTFAGDGLFTAWTEESNWQKAHRILLPAFSQPAMKGYHSMMVDIASQLVQKWSRLNPDETIDVPDDMTRLTLDTIGLCGFNYRFNSYYRETPNPFILSMVRALDEAMHRGNRLPIQNRLMMGTTRQFTNDIQAMYSLVDQLIIERKSRGDQGETDLLARMLNVTDPETGEPLDDANIRHQIITFLIAGHETTSGLLSFAIYFLLKHPDVLEKAYQEVDEAISGPVPTYKEVLQLKYIRMILNESLRLYPTAPGFALYAKQDTIIGGKYAVNKGEVVFVHIPKLHRDKGAWGEDAESFRPERFADPSNVPNNAYKPFGNGQRACIGMQFALHEATLVLAMILQRFKFVDYANYQLKVKQTLTLKPEEFKIRIQLRDKNFDNFFTMQPEPVDVVNKHDTPLPKASVIGVNNRPLQILYGSDMGGAEQLAKQLADLARSYGIQTQVATLNDGVDSLPTEGAVLIVTSSYNGKPPSNARKFVQWLEQVKPDRLKGVHFSVFGCGDYNWASTYQAVPRLIDELLVEKGATRFSARGEGDASSDFEKQFDDWKLQMWTDAMTTFHLKMDESAKKEKGGLRVQFVSGFTETPLAETYQAVHGVVTENRELHRSGSNRSTRHIEIQLPTGVTYQEGDHAGVLASNALKTVNRVLKRFALKHTDQVILTADGISASHLPLDRPVSVVDLLRQSVELQEPATRAQIREIAAFTVCPPHQRELELLLADDKYQAEILKKRVTMLDLVEKYEACEIPFEHFLMLLPSLKPRYYSISSSPLISPERVSITVGVIQGPAWSGFGEYRGVASNDLANKNPGDEVVLFVRTPESGFQLPENPQTPVIMVGPGTGLAPFRGFLQARVALQEQGVALGLAHLYYGCRDEDEYLYREELEQFHADGIVTLYTGFSRKGDVPKTYVQHLIMENAPEVIDMLDHGARLYVCGDGRHMAPDVEATLRTAYQSVHAVDEETAQFWLERLIRNGNYAKDVWSGI